LKRIAIFENQYNQVKIQFEVANKIFFNDTLQYTQFNSSQDYQPIENIVEFDLVIVDISLSSNSDLDGFDLITTILLLADPPKILILTGNSNIKENLKKRQLPDLPILMKPIDPIDIQKNISALLA